MAAILAAFAAPALPGLIAALAQSGINIGLAIQQANAINASPDPTPADWAALDTALGKALDNSEMLQKALEVSRAAALRTAAKKAG